MPFVPDTAPEAASAPRGRFVPDAPPPAAPEPLPARVPGTSIGLGIPGVDLSGPPAARRSKSPTGSGRKPPRATRSATRWWAPSRARSTSWRRSPVAASVAWPACSPPFVTGGSAEKMEEGAQRGVGVVRDIYRQTGITNGQEPQTEFGRTVTEGFDTAMAVLPLGGRGQCTARWSAKRRKVRSYARRAVGDTARAVGDAARRPLRRLQPAKAALAEKAVGEGIPINLHQLTDNKAAKLAGEYAETIPGSGSKRERVAWRSPTPSPARLIPSPTATAITPDVFVEMQDKAGGEIGNIMARYEVPARHVR